MVCQKSLAKVLFCGKNQSTLATQLGWKVSKACALSINKLLYSKWYEASLGSDIAWCVEVNDWPCTPKVVLLESYITISKENMHLIIVWKETNEKHSKVKCNVSESNNLQENEWGEEEPMIYSHCIILFLANKQLKRWIFTLSTRQQTRHKAQWKPFNKISRLVRLRIINFHFPIF